ncbi:hypothetical protein [Roseovarius amoyensis]|uniref:hypothetical protein n=1 Tax=Roseovarius amoyensis TaxID=2211448 RepID=UPI0013A6C4E9|nr:hypothetical protein [Roseovarius amoyensis]
MTLTDDIRRDLSRPQVAKKSSGKWHVVSDDPAPGWVGVAGPSFGVRTPTTATDLNGEDYIARHADARRIARVPEMEARILADAEALKAADEHLVKRLKALQTYFNLDEEELASLTKDERADTIRQHRLISEALTAYRKAREGQDD